MRATTILFFVLLTYGLSQAQIPPAPHRRVVSISGANKHGNEPSIAINPNNPNQVVAVFQPATVAYSTDGSQTFLTADLLPIEGWRAGGDVSITFDNKGHTYLSTLHFDKLGSTSYWAHAAGKNGIFVRRSLDGGKTWEKDAVAVKTYNGVEAYSHMEDMPRIFADAQPQS